MLERQGLTLSRIAAECGFSDLRQFRRIFTRLEKMSPRQYRKANEKRMKATTEA